MKKYFQIIAAFLLLFAFAGCVHNGGDSTTAVTETTELTKVVQAQTASTEETESPTTEEPTDKPTESTTDAATAAPKKEEKPDISADELYDANMISNLLSTYSCVHIQSQYDGMGNVSQYSILGEDIMYITLFSADEDETSYMGSYKNFRFETGSKRTTAYILLDDINNNVSLLGENENAVSEIFMYSEAEFVKEDGENYVFKVTYPEEYGNDFELFVTVLKDTLAVVKAVYQYNDGTSRTINYTLGEEPKDYGGIISKWQGKLKTVSVVAEKTNGKSKTVKEAEIELPSNWELIIQDYEYDMNMYMDKGCTVPYKYPGNGKSYTLYATNAMG